MVILQNGEIIVYPTDTLYGFGVDATNQGLYYAWGPHQHIKSPATEKGHLATETLGYMANLIDKPEDESLWTIDRFVDEVEQVRQALNLNSENFIILGHSWGGILGLEYALKYQNNLKALIISNMVPSIPEYIDYANNVLAPKLDPEVLKKIREYESAEDYTNSEYLSLIEKHYYTKHSLRMPLDQWPDPVTRSLNKSNFDIYLRMQGPSEFGVVGDVVLK